jgi:hypothetical protein
MKDLEREKILGGLKSFDKVAGIQALNFMLSDHKYISSSRRNLCLKYFVDKQITELIVVDREKLKELEMIRRTGRKENEVIPHSRVTEDFLDVLITAKQDSEKDNFFIYKRNQLLLFADEKSRKPIEKVLRQWG